MNDGIPPVERIFFKWNIKDFGFCLINTKDTLMSPVFELQRSKTFWYLEINLYNINNKVYCIPTRLCRPFMQVGPPEVKVRFSLCLETLLGEKIWGNESYMFSFAPGSSCGSDFEKAFITAPSILKTTNTLVVTCDMFLIVDEAGTVVDPDLQLLSQDFKRLLENGTGNTKLIVGEQKVIIQAHKEILSARSSVFGDFFNRGDDNEFQIPEYSPEVVKPMLAFIYSGDITELVNDPTLFDVLRCALKYKVSHLLDIIQPTWMFAASEFEYLHDEYNWTYTNLTETIAAHNSINTGLVTLKFENIQFKATMFFHGRTVLHIEMCNLGKIDIFIMEVSICKYTYACISKLEVIRPKSDGTCDFNVLTGELHSENENAIFPHDSMHVNFQFKFKLKQSRVNSHITYFIDRPKYYRTKLTLSNQMKTFFKFRTNPDAKVVFLQNENSEQPPEKEINVHSSILSIRSDVFNECFKEGRDIEWNISRNLAETIIFYMYTGCISNVPFDSLVKIYDIAPSISLPQLQYKCLQLISKCIVNGDNV